MVRVRIWVDLLDSVLHHMALPDSMRFLLEEETVISITDSAQGTRQ